ncbi:phosphatidylinositol/phosphatidylcholine transfer protein SFH11-like [Aristolochia californica]|uniref:phosphatidylinositol/phosphatidylcholine transfer protein SFH11-like n=1 Tax=Aristolochia californica TaxID=171875 RepID=UPI0035DF9ADF
MPSTKGVGKAVGKPDNPDIRFRKRSDTLKLPIEEHWRLPQPTKKQLPLAKRLNLVRKFRNSLKRVGRSKSMQEILEGPRDPDDEQLVQEFHSLLLKEGQLSKNHDDYHTLLRFLRMKAFDMQKAKEMYQKMLVWRRDNGVDTIEQEFSFKELSEVKRCYPNGYHGVDRYGRPLYIERIGMLDLDALLKVTTVERFVKYHIMEQEKTLKWRFPACSLAAKRHVASTTAILDVAGVGKNNFSKSARDIFIEIQRIDSNYYPETLFRLFIVNAGSGFRVLWKALKAFLEARTVAKIHVLGSDFRSKLTEFIEPSNLPTFLSGNCTCSEHGGCLSEDKGPWTDPEITELIQVLFEKEQNFSRESSSLEDDDYSFGAQNVGETEDLVQHQQIENLLQSILSKQDNLEQQMKQLKLLTTTILSCVSI